MDTYLLYTAVGLLAVLIILVIVLLLKKTNESISKDEFLTVKKDIQDEVSRLRSEVNDTIQKSIANLSSIISENQKASGNAQSEKIESLGKNTVEKLDTIHSGISRQLNQLSANTEERFKTFAIENEKKLEAIRQTVENKLTYIQTDNNQKLDEMRKIVDEKLQKTLEDRMTKSFQLVSERLEQVYKGLGEMQTLATGVGDLKKVLSNVKTRGILGEIQLGAILEEILSPEQYETNIVTSRTGRNPVEYAVKLPTEDDTCIYLPIDSKFPGDAYTDLVEAYDTGDREKVDEAVKTLTKRISLFAKDIHDKYIDPPNTTDFAIMFLPFEGLYAEVVNRGMVEKLQRDYHINVAGPSTMAALLNSLQMGFKTFAIQKRSGEVWNVLGAVKTEFDNFSGILDSTKKRLEQAQDDLEKLIGTRTRQIRRKLKDVTSLPSDMSKQILAIGTDDIDDPDDID